MSNIAEEAREITERAKQLQAVRRYMEEHGVIDKRMTLEEGVPGYGKIWHVGARICEMRDMGYVIRTEKVRWPRNTYWHLVERPAAKQLAITL
jgi:hypothetical protein